MKEFLLQFFTWWNGQTLGVRFATWRKGSRVGEDEQGNIYYQNGNQRWVIYNGEAEPSRIPDGWHGWIHHRTDTPPSEEDYAMREWQVPHTPNLTGTPGAYRPAGSLARQDKRPEPTGDYEAWSP
ncbi:MAG: NADH:ubiquinone oxidoreductase subunit NDUFA12 [Ahrensia sp.]|nr:NADH:ubiquinone oxidoreductase subunit NDUFA12 [Ahrensia sp.]